MRIFFVLLLMSASLASISAVASQSVEVTGVAIGYRCFPAGDNSGIQKIAKMDAVERAEEGCNWDMGRPVVRRRSDWKIKVECRDRRSDDLYFGHAYASATFDCNSNDLRD